MSIKYKIPPSTLDSFAWMRKSEDDGAVQEFLDRLNRVEIQPSDAMLRGSAFEDVLNAMAMGVPPSEEGGLVKVHDREVEIAVFRRVHERLRGSLRQVYVEAPLQTSRGEVLIYGYVDFLLRDTIIDTKTTAKYVFPKYLHGFQRPAYLHCLDGTGIDKFLFLVTDFDDVYEERYDRSADDLERLREGCTDLIEFLEANRDKINDKKLFALE